MGKFLDSSPTILKNAIDENLKSLDTLRLTTTSNNKKERQTYDISRDDEDERSLKSSVLRTVQISPVSVAFNPSHPISIDAVPFDLSKISFSSEQKDEKEKMTVKSKSERSTSSFEMIWLRIIKFFNRNKTPSVEIRRSSKGRLC